MDKMYEVCWNRHLVGYYAVESNDMWYYEGNFTPILSQIRIEFKERLIALIPGAVFNDFSKGIPVIMHPQSKLQDEWHVILMGFLDDKLHLRGVTYLVKEYKEQG